MSLARIIVFALALTHAVGLADLLLGDTCDKVCRDDGRGDECLPGVACRCHAPSPAQVPMGTGPVVTRVRADRAPAPAFAVNRAHASPDPREILHVPKRAA